MRKSLKVFRRFFNEFTSEIQPLTGIPIVELTSDTRILIENHQGVSEFTNERISIRVKFGRIVTCGSTLEIAFMSKHQLVISGQIKTISVERNRL